MPARRRASLSAGSLARPPNITWGMRSSCAATAARMWGWLYPWQAVHHDAMPSISSRPSERTMRVPLVAATGNGGGTLAI